MQLRCRCCKGEDLEREDGEDVERHVYIYIQREREREDITTARR